MAQQVISPPAASAMPLTRAQRWNTLKQGLLFVAGFATFIIGFFGVAGTVLGDVFYDLRDWVRIIGGVMMIVFGLFTLGILRIPILYRDTRRDMGNVGGVAGKVGGVRSYVTGLGFAAGWTPCIGPFLGAILSMSVTAELGTRIAMLIAYTLGLGIPFLLVAALTDKMVPMLRRVQKHMRLVEIISGLLLIGIGLALLFGQMTQLSSVLAAAGPSELETMILGNASLSIPVAAIAGLLSFLSPCVLPLVPAYVGFIGGVAVNSARQPA